ncbi:hypothetical protein VdG1_09107 [Verticillium dahliae VDG1]|nr:hypothetical protein VdG1_09107 [Verticillium dahliae VDG1]
MLRHRGQDIQRLRLRQHLGSPKTARNHRHALRNPTRPKVFPYRIAFSLPSSGIVMRDGDSAPGELDLEASLHKDVKTRCPACDEAGYCSKDCRADDEAFHAEVCGLLDAMEEGTRPSAAHRLLICFAPDYATPFFLWGREVAALVSPYFDEDEPRHPRSLDIETESLLAFLKNKRECDAESIEDVYGDLVF